jgi:hypothetical protein
VNYHIAFAREANTVAETLIKTCAVEMTTCVLGELLKKKLEAVKLFNGTVERLIQDLSAGKKQLVSLLKSSFAFSLQLDESTDLSGLAAVLVFVRYLLQKKTKEDLLAKCAVLKFLPFPTTYLCEAGFSRYEATKYEYRYRLDVTPD